MPSPRADPTTLINLFHQFNLTVTDLVALSSSHSIGDGRCFSVIFRLNNQSGTGKPDPAINPDYRHHLNRQCPANGDGNVAEGMDLTQVALDNRYFRDLVRGRGILNSDQTLFSGGARRRGNVVLRFSVDEAAFFAAFVEGMVKMGDLQSGRPGEIRRNRRRVHDHVSKMISSES